MQPFDPPVIKQEFLKKAGISNIQIVPVKPSINALPDNCLKNVQAFISENGGTIQLGWKFSIIGNVAKQISRTPILN